MTLLIGRGKRLRLSQAAAPNPSHLCCRSGPAPRCKKSLPSAGSSPCERARRRAPAAAPSPCGAAAHAMGPQITKMVAIILIATKMVAIILIATKMAAVAAHAPNNEEAGEKRRAKQGSEESSGIAPRQVGERATRASSRSCLVVITPAALRWESAGILFWSAAEAAAAAARTAAASAGPFADARWAA